jgi:hypothetical protein
VHRGVVIWQESMGNGCVSRLVIVPAGFDAASSPDDAHQAPWKHLAILAIPVYGPAARPVGWLDELSGDFGVTSAPGLTFAPKRAAKACSAVSPRPSARTLRPKVSNQPTYISGRKRPECTLHARPFALTSSCYAIWIWTTQELVLDPA